MSASNGALNLADLEVDARFGLRVHPFADSFPSMQGKPFADLVADIKANGLLDPIVVVMRDGHEIILDGRNRMRACIAAGVPPTTEQFIETDDGYGFDDAELIRFVLSKNVQRRNMTPSMRAQRVLDGAKIAAAIKKANAKSKRAQKKQEKEEEALCNVAKLGDETKRLADEAGVSPRTMADVQAVAASGDVDLAADIREGRTSASAAGKKARAKRTTKKRRLDPSSARSVARKLFAKHADDDWRIEFLKEFETLLDASIALISEAE